MARLLTLTVIGLLFLGCDDGERNSRQSPSAAGLDAATGAADAQATAAPSIASPGPDRLADPTIPKGSVEVRVKVLNETMVLFPTVFNPKIEADNDVLPFMTAHRDLF